MPRRSIVKVVLSMEQKGILKELARRLGISESETLRMALMDYAKEVGMVREKLQTRSNSHVVSKSNISIDTSPIRG